MHAGLSSPAPAVSYRTSQGGFGNLPHSKESSHTVKDLAEELVTVYAVFHTARDPDKWRKRLSSSG